MAANHDRDFQDIHLFLAGTNLALHQHVVRIFDLEWLGSHALINAHQFGGPNQQTGMDIIINLAVCRGAMRFLLPSTDTRPSGWRDWTHQVGEVTVNEWTPWTALLTSDAEAACRLALRPWETCFKLRRSPPSVLRIREEQTVGGGNDPDDARLRVDSIGGLYDLCDIYQLPKLEPPERSESTTPV